MKMTRRIGTGWGRRWAFLLLSSIACAASAALPEGVTQLEYIKGDGKTYFDTGWMLDPVADRFETTFALTVSENLTLWCTRDASSKNSQTMFSYGSSYVRSDFGASQREMSRTIPLTFGRRYTVSVSNATVVVDNGARADHSLQPDFTNAPGPLLLFAACNYYPDGSMSNLNYIGKHQLMSFKIWRNNELVRDWVPVRTADNLVTLADAVEGTILEPLGTGAFTAGPVANLQPFAFNAVAPTQFVSADRGETRPVLSVTDAETGVSLLPGIDYTVNFAGNDGEGIGQATLTPTEWSSCATGRVTTVEFPVLQAPPAEYERLEYIQGDGNSYLLTDYRPNAATDTLDVEYAFTRLEVVGTWCARKQANGDPQSFSLCFLQDGSTIKYRFDYGNGQVFANKGRLLTNVRYRVTAANRNLWASNGDNAFAADRIAAQGEAGGNLMIGAYYDGPAAYNPSSFSTQRYYAFKVKRSGRLIHDWVPVRTPEGDATLYDLVEGKALTPRGKNGAKGTFIAGPLPAVSVEIAEIPVQILPSDGGACTPAPVVTQAGTHRRLAAGTDYALSYANNGQAGLATLTVTGIGAYAGRLSPTTVPFAVAPALPEGLTRLEYIQGNGATRLLTDWTIRPHTDRVETDIELTDVANAAIWCSRGGTTGENTFTLFRLVGGNFRCDSTPNMITVGWSGLFPVNKTFRVSAQGGDFTVGDVRLPRTTGATFTQAGGPLMLFASYYAGTGSNLDFYSRHKSHYFSVYREGVLVRHWVPVRTSQGVATMCDLMTGSVLTPLGTGFIAGPLYADFDVTLADQLWDGETKVKPPVAVTNRLTGAALNLGADYRITYESNAAEGWGRATAYGLDGTPYAGQARSVDFRILLTLPEGYERLTYLQGDGKSYFLTDYMPHPKTDTVIFDFELRKPDTVTGLLCSREGGMNKSWSFCGMTGPNFRFDISWDQIQFWAPGMVPGMRFAVKMQNGTVTLSDGISATSKDNPLSLDASGGPMMMMAYYNNSTSLTATSFSFDRVYGCQVSRSGALLHDWVPVRTPDGVVTLHDRVTGDDLEPKGTGAFIAGPAWVCEGPFIPPHATILIVR